jgi:hypothetical protein
VGDAARGHSLYPEAFFERAEAIPQPTAAAQHDGHHNDVQVVNQVSGRKARMLSVIGVMCAYGRGANIRVVAGCDVSELQWLPVAWWRWVGLSAAWR